LADLQVHESCLPNDLPFSSERQGRARAYHGREEPRAQHAASRHEPTYARTRVAFVCCNGQLGRLHLVEEWFPLGRAVGLPYVNKCPATSGRLWNEQPEPPSGTGIIVDGPALVDGHRSTLHTCRLASIVSGNSKGELLLGACRRRWAGRCLMCARQRRHKGNRRDSGHLRRDHPSLPNDTAVQRRTHEGAKRPRRPSVCNGWLGSALRDRVPA